MMMTIAKAIGLATSLAAASTAEVRLTRSPWACRSAMRRNAFSTMTTAPSTIMPMPMARPASDIRLAERPNCCMPMNAISIASGKATITTSAERSSPRNRNSTSGHQHRALDQRGRRGADGLVDQIGALVDRLQHHALRQRRADRGELGGDCIHHVLGVLADARQRHAEHDLLAVAGHRAKARRRRLNHGGHVAQVHRHAVLGLEHDRTDVLGGAQQPEAAHQVLLATDVHHVAADLAVVGGDRVQHVAEPKSAGIQALRIDAHLVLPLAAAPGRDVVDARARCAASAAPSSPAACAGPCRSPVPRLTPGRAFDGVPEHLSQARRVRPHARLAIAFGQPIADFLQPLVGELAREVDVHVVFEINGDERQARTG